MSADDQSYLAKLRAARVAALGTDWGKRRESRGAQEKIGEMTSELARSRMAAVTYYVVVTFDRNDAGDLVAGPPLQVTSAEVAHRRLALRGARP